eukprot:TRINITY_DN18025_c0_g1_i1.p3 TRINITY_DN18025_c0_g1~~TRINITY_DN18025_c0_g1_i1.p3  ORF type:complete len:200 (+),score=56.66 TRINITY_DN18025_c0_g1_i1:32-631(+)
MERQVFRVRLGKLFFFSSRRRHTRCREVSWARRCVQETVSTQSTWGLLLKKLFSVVYFPPSTITIKMDAKTAKAGFQDAPQIHHIRITLSSRNVKNLEKVCSDLIRAAKDKNVRTKGPIRIPTKVLRITTRKTPCGEGSKTWDRFEMRVHKRVVDIFSPTEVVKQITSFSIEAGVEVEVTIADLQMCSLRIQSGDVMLP